MRGGKMSCHGPGGSLTLSTWPPRFASRFAASASCRCHCFWRRVATVWRPPFLRENCRHDCRREREKLRLEDKRRDGPYCLKASYMAGSQSVGRSLGRTRSRSEDCIPYNPASFFNHWNCDQAGKMNLKFSGVSASTTCAIVCVRCSSVGRWICLRPGSVANPSFPRKRRTEPRIRRR